MKDSEQAPVEHQEIMAIPEENRYATALFVEIFLALASAASCILLIGRSKRRPSLKL